MEMGRWRWGDSNNDLAAMGRVLRTDSNSLATMEPMNIFVNGKSHACPADFTVTELIDQLGLTGKRLAVERNQVLVARALHASTRLQEGDRLEIVVAVGGG